MAQAPAARLSASLSSGSYNHREVLDYLRDSLIHGVRADSQVLLKALLIALTRFPHHEFTTLLSLVPLQVQESRDKEYEPIRFLKDLEDLLERGNFTAFWRLWEKRPETVPVTQNFEDRMRSAIAGVLADSVVKTSVSNAATALALSDVLDFLGNSARNSSGISFKVVGEDLVFAQNEFNHPVSSTVGSEKLSLERVAGFSNVLVN